MSERGWLFAGAVLMTIGLISGFWEGALLLPLAWLLAVALPL